MMMKQFFLGVSLAVLSLSVTLPQSVEAKRLGGGSSVGMKRATPQRPAPTNQTPAPGQQAPAANQATPPTPAAPAAPKRSWMGPLAGLAAGLGLAALMSHLGMGAGFANFLTMVLIAVVAFVAIRFVLRRFAPAPANRGLQYAAAGGDSPRGDSPWTGQGSAGTHWPASGSSSPSPAVSAASASAPALPAGFDAEGFQRIAKLIFIRMQAANDAADLNDLRAFTTPEMFAAVKLDLQERGTQAQQTDVVQLNAEVVDVEQEAVQQVVSVRFHGLIREEAQGAANAFDEVWHLVRPLDGSREWAIAGIAQSA